MTEATLDDRGRLTLPKEMREQYGDHYYVVEVHDGIKLIRSMHSGTSSRRSTSQRTAFGRVPVSRHWTRQAAKCT